MGGHADAWLMEVGCCRDDIVVLASLAMPSGVVEGQDFLLKPCSEKDT